MRASIFSLLFGTALFVAGCGGSDKSLSLADDNPPADSANPGDAGAQPGPVGGLDDTAPDAGLPGQDPLASDLPGADLPADGIPEVPGDATPDAPDVDLPGDDVNLPPAADALPTGAVLPTPWGANQPLFGSSLSVETFPLHRVVSGGPPKDGIPALNNPPFVAASTPPSWLGEDDLVLGVVVGGVARAYPHNIGWWHEIVNDRVGDQAVCVTFCPLTGTGLVFDANDENGNQFELGVSGQLYNNNLIMYDRRDNSTLYPQIYSTAVLGPRTGESLSLMPVVETTWATWKRLHPDTEVIANGTKSSSQYTRYPYGDYRINNSYLLFALNPPLSDNPNAYANIFGAKDGMLGVRLDGHARAYLFDEMGDQAAINDQVGGVDIVVLWDRASSLAIPYASEVDGQSLSFEIDDSTGFPFSLVDRETGSLWNARGEAIDGPLAGAQLTQVPAHNSFWFAWVSFWRDTDVWQM